MKNLRLLIYTCCFFGLSTLCFAQPHWKLSKDKDGIRVFLAEKPGSKYKSIRVECTMPGTFDKLIAVLTDIDHLKDWVYNTKTSYVIKKLSPLDLFYYSETTIPWPMSNRDAVIHLRITKDSLGRFMKVHSTNENRLVPEKDGNVRILYSEINWHVTMPTPKTLSIVYTFEADPGGNLPAWLVNSFADKGPYESFHKLAEMMRNK
jgi:START domain-containing protein